MEDILFNIYIRVKEGNNGKGNRTAKEEEIKTLSRVRRRHARRNKWRHED